MSEQRARSLSVLRALTSIDEREKTSQHALITTEVNFPVFFLNKMQESADGFAPVTSNRRAISVDYVVGPRSFPFQRISTLYISREDVLGLNIHPKHSN